VGRVIGRLHTPLLDAGVRLVDTPGVGSVQEHNTRSTDACLPSLDAAVLVTSADPPISKAERVFLERVLEHAVRLFVVLNKADYLAAGDVDRTVAFTERIVREVLPDWPGPVYPPSARTGVGDPDGLRRFREDLARFLREERATVVTDSVRRSASRGLGALRLALDLERRAALPAEELATRRTRFAATVDRLAGDAVDDAALLGAAVRRGLEALDAILARQRAELASRAQQATLEAAERYPDAAPGRLLELLQAQRPAMLERLSRDLVERAGAAAVAAYRLAAAGWPSGPPAESSDFRPRRPAPSGCPCPPLSPRSGPGDRPGQLRLTSSDAARRAARVGGLAAARRPGGTGPGPSPGPVSRPPRRPGCSWGGCGERPRSKLGEAARQLGARLQGHHAALAASLTAAVERGGGLLAEAEDHRRRWTAQLDRAAKLLHEVTVGFQREPAQPGGHVDGRSASEGRAL
jgi:hypothetical protein